MSLDFQKLLECAIEASLYAGDAILEIYNTDDFNIEIKDDKSPLTLADKKSNSEITKRIELTRIPVLSEEGKNIEYNERKNWEYFWLIDPLDGTKEFINRNGEFTVNIALINKGTPILGVVYVPVQEVLYYSYVPNGAYMIKNINSNAFKGKNVNSILSRSSKLPLSRKRDNFLVVGSRSHMNDDTKEYIEKVKKKYGDIEIVSRGSSLKICMVAEGEANLYPRFGPTMEWDTAAGHCIAIGAGLEVTQKDGVTPLQYNKENLLNPYFIVKPQGFTLT